MNYLIQWGYIHKAYLELETGQLTWCIPKFTETVDSASASVLSLLDSNLCGGGRYRRDGVVGDVSCIWAALVSGASGSNRKVALNSREQGAR